MRRNRARRWEAAPAALRLLLQDGDLGLEIGGLNVGDQTHSKRERSRLPISG